MFLLAPWIYFIFSMQIFNIKINVLHDLGYILLIFFRVSDLLQAYRPIDHQYGFSSVQYADTCLNLFINMCIQFCSVY